MKLYGTQVSPYARRLRLLLDDSQYEFIEMDILTDEGRQALAVKNPIMKIPMLEDEELMVYDSAIIFRYIQQKLSLPPLTWQQENTLTMINAVNDSLVELMICIRSSIDINADKMLFNFKHKRIDSVLGMLNDQVASGEFSQWDYPAMCLFALLDWMEFREFKQYIAYPALVNFLLENKQQPRVHDTDPRL